MREEYIKILKRKKKKSTKERKHKYLYKYILSEHNRNTQVSYLTLVSATGHTALAGIFNYLLTTHSVFPLPSARTSAGFGSFPEGMSHTFIPNKSVTFAILLRLGCCSL